MLPGQLPSLAGSGHGLKGFSCQSAFPGSGEGTVLDQVWGDHVYVEERTVDVHIRRLRKALTPSGHDKLIQTVRGTGYRLSSKH